MTYEIRSGTGAGFSPSLNFSLPCIISPLPHTRQSPKTRQSLGLDLVGFGVRMLVTFLGFQPFDVAGANTRCGHVY